MGTFKIVCSVRGDHSRLERSDIVGNVLLIVLSSINKSGEYARTPPHCESQIKFVKSDVIRFCLMEIRLIASDKVSKEDAQL